MTGSACSTASSPLSKEGLTHRITQRIRRSLDLSTILNTTAAEIQQFLEIDRVKIYQFHADGSGLVVAEYLDETRPLPSLYGLNFPADDIPPETRQLFIEARVRTVVDVASRQIGQSRLRDPETGEVLAGDWVFRSLDPCHAEYLTAMGVCSSVVAPILHQERLWGLLVGHHSESRTLTEEQLRGVQQVVDQLSVAIAQSLLLQQAQEKAEREITLNHVTCLLHSFTTIELQQALESTAAAFQASGGRLFVQPEVLACPAGSEDCFYQAAPQLYTWGSQPRSPESMRLPLLEQSYAVQNQFKSGDRTVWAIEDLYQVAVFRNLQPTFQTTAIRSVLILPLVVRQQTVGYLTLFRDQFDTEVLWAGQVDPDVRQTLPRQSFGLWRQSQTGQTRPWTIEEQELARAIAAQFAAAIEQHELHQQIQTLNTNLEGQVEERTAQLQQATAQQAMLFEVVTRMRKSLDLDTIFTTVTQEVRDILNTDRVMVYRFDLDSAFNDGEVIAEAVLPSLGRAIAAKIHDHCFGDRYAHLYAQGRVSAVTDIHAATFNPCFLAILKQFQIRAMLIAPIMNGTTLWGLLCVHQCDQPRTWQNSEIQFVTQVCAQMSVALEQADLLRQTQQQSHQLSQTLENLQHTQSQLVQTEKMSSLGQLVAGVAHEINNPVNFIHGNLTHINRYTESLLELLAFYQTDLPHPPARIQEQIEALDLDFVREDLPKILNSMRLGTERIRQIVLSLRNFSRLDQAEMKPVDIHEGIDSTLMILQHRLKITNESSAIKLIKEYTQLPLVECYAGQLNQVFMNILCNAIDELEERDLYRSTEEKQNHPSTIHIQTGRLDEKSVWIRISDNGKGIPEAIRSRLFDPFFTTKPIGKGTGLGLSISYQIVVEKHGGLLQCTSQPDQGTAFLIEIPIHQS